jgi:hypothetical protein
LRSKARGQDNFLWFAPRRESLIAAIALPLMKCAQLCLVRHPKAPGYLSAPACLHGIRKELMPCLPSCYDARV